MPCDKIMLLYIELRGNNNKVFTEWGSHCLLLDKKLNVCEQNLEEESNIFFILIEACTDMKRHTFKL